MIKINEQVQIALNDLIENLTMSILETKRNFNESWVSFSIYYLTKSVEHCTIIMEKGNEYMIDEKIILSPNDILEKEFKIDARGYRPQEVDKFLDLVIKDYVEYDKLLKKYENELKSVLDENSKLKSEMRNLKSTLSVAETNKGVTNVDILRRLGELEKIVYGEEQK